MPQIAFTINAELRSIDNSDGGPHHIFPPTYAAGLGHNLVGYDGATGRADKVLIDSVQSMANRVETALLIMDVLPRVTTQVGDRTLSINELPARAYDVILRDSLLDGIPGRLSDLQAAVKRQVRPSLAPSIGYQSRKTLFPSTGCGDLLVLRPNQILPMTQTALWADKLRRAVMSSVDDPIPEIVHGHGAHRRVAWTALSDVNYKFSDGHILGLGVWMPRGASPAERGLVGAT